jgi:hypothetical protein
MRVTAKLRALGSSKLAPYRTPLSPFGLSSATMVANLYLSIGRRFALSQEEIYYHDVGGPYNYPRALNVDAEYPLQATIPVRTADVVQIRISLQLMVFASADSGYSVSSIFASYYSSTQSPGRIVAPGVLIDFCR